MTHTDADLAGYVEELTEQGVRLVGGSVVDMGGVARAKYVPTPRLAAFHRVGMGASPCWSVFCVDGNIAFTPELNVIGDLRILIDPAELRVVEDGIAWAPGEFHDQGGGSNEMCARSALRRAVATAEAAGLTALVGAELECTLLGPDGGHATRGARSPYGLRTSLEQAAFLADLARVGGRGGTGSRAAAHGVRPRPARDLALPLRSRSRRRQRGPRPARARQGCGPARHAGVLLAAPVRGRGRQRRPSPPVARHLRRSGLRRRHRSTRPDLGRRVGDRRDPRRPARADRRVRRLCALAVAAAARQLGRRGALLGSGEP